MKYILDSSVALKTVLPEIDSAQAIKLVEDFHNSVHELLAPDVFYIEIAHALTRAERQGRLASPDAWQLWRVIMADCPILMPTISLMPRAISLSSQARIGIYDCLYVALAEREGCELVTADEKLVKSLPQAPIISLSSL